MKWFKHDTDSLRNRKIRKVVRVHGATGYAVWFAVLEKLYEMEDGFQVEADELWLEDLADDLKISDYRILIRVLDTFAEVGLISSQLWQGEHTVYCEAIAERGDNYIEKRAKEAEKKRVQRAKKTPPIPRVSPGDKKGTSGQMANVPPSEIRSQRSEVRDQRLDPEVDLNLSHSSGSIAPEAEKKSDPSEREAALPFVQHLPQGLFPHRGPIAVPVTPTFQGPWGIGCTPEQVRFDEWLQSEARKKGMRDPSAYAFKIIDSIAKGGPTGKWTEFLASTGQASAAPDPADEWAEELRRRLAKDSDHTMVGRAWCNESEGQERANRRQFLNQFLKEYLHAKQAS